MSTPQVLTLPSNSSMTYYPDNTITQFKVELATPLTLVEPHEVALVGLHYTRSWYNFSAAEVFNVRYDREGDLGEETPPMSGDDEDDDDDEEAEEASSRRSARSPISYRAYSLHLESGHYLDIWQVLKQLNLKRAPVEWTYSEVSRKVSLIWREPGWTVLLKAPVARKLGWPGRVLLRRPAHSPRRLWAPGVVNLDEVDLLYVHCDLAADSHLVGDKRVPLLAAVSVQGRMGEVVHYEPRVLDWLPVRSSYVSTIEVLITDGAGRRVPFETGATLVKVHLRRRSPFS